MKIGIVGKGGVGKTTTSSLLARVLVSRGRRVLAVDTDSNPNLGLSLGLSPEATETLAPIPRSMVVGQRGDMTIAELMDAFSVLTPEGVALMSALRVDEAGAGCTCGGHASVKSLLGQALEAETDDTIIDMEAGIEHLSRAGGTLANADVLILMMEPSRKAVITAQRTIGLAKELGIARWVGVGNKVDSDEARRAIEELCSAHEVPLDVIIPSTTDIVAADRRGEPLDRSIAPDVWDAVESLVDALSVDSVPVA
jgi:CO dehydrogenase maturation factor